MSNGETTFPHCALQMAIVNPYLGGEEPGEQLAVGVVLDELVGDHGEDGPPDDLEVEDGGGLGDFAARQPGVGEPPASVQRPGHHRVYFTKNGNL